MRFLFVLMLMLPPAAGLAATLMVYGDSLSAGYGMPQEQGWVNLLQKKLQAEKLNYKVVNLSISGETTLGGKNRIARALETHRPAIVILALGANDGLRGQNLEAMRANLEAIIQTCRRLNARVLLVGMRLPPNYGASYGEKFHQTYIELARRHKLALVPFLLEGFAGDFSMFQPDGIHPAAPAQARMMETVWKTLRPLLLQQ